MAENYIMFTERNIDEYIFKKIDSEPGVRDFTPLQRMKYFWMSYRKAIECSNDTQNQYKSYVAKRKGKKHRVINVPKGELKSHQRFILKSYLDKIPVNETAYAYRKGCRVKDPAIVHYVVDKEYLLKLDIRDFFGSIKASDVYHVFEDAFPEAEKELIVFFTNICCLNGKLPQGAPSSPALSNIIMRPFDDEVSEFARKKGIIYTRYSDDMIFSFNEKELAETIEELIGETLKKYGFKLNLRKTRLSRRKGQRCSVLGIVINEKLRLPVEYRRKIRQEIYYIRKFGIKHHMAKSRVNGTDYGLCLYKEPLVPDEDAFEYLRKIKGRIEYVLGVDPDDDEMKEYRLFLDELIKKMRSYIVRKERGEFMSMSDQDIPF